MSAGAPPVRLSDPVRKDLEAHRPGLADETERMLLAHARPCVTITAKRVARAPLRRNPIARLFGCKPADPILGPTASKFGGRPYSEDDDEWRGRAFLGQIDLTAATAGLPPSAPRLRGLVRLEMPTNGDPLQARWFPEIDAACSRDARPPCVGTWETRLDFAPAWTLPEGNDFDALWPIRDLLVPREDLQRGDLSRLVVTGANS